MVSASVVAPKANLELESHPDTVQASSSHAWQPLLDLQYGSKSLVNLGDLLVG